MESLKERSLRVQKEGGSGARWFLSSRARRKTGSAPSGLLFSLYYSVFFAALLGGRYERKIVNYIFFDVPGDAGPVFPPAEEFSGFRPFRLRLLSFTQVLQIQLIDMLEHADAVAKLDVREGIVTGSQRGSDFLSFLDP